MHLRPYLITIRDALSDKVKARQIWQKITEVATYQGAVWHREDLLPQSWALGEMEGAQRMRIRLVRCSSGVEAKHYKPDHASKGRDLLPRSDR